MNKFVEILLRIIATLGVLVAHCIGMLSLYLSEAHVTRDCYDFSYEPFAYTMLIPLFFISIAVFCTLCWLQKPGKIIWHMVWIVLLSWYVLTMLLPSNYPLCTGG